jgi:hypothetical protein
MAAIHWIQSTYSGNYTVSSSAITENNLQFTLASLNAYSSWVALFDQYCIYSAHVRLSIIGEGYTTSLGTLATAIDYDSTGNLGTYVGIQDYSTVQVNTVEVGMSYERFIKPCVASALYNVSTAGFSGYGIARSWVDCVNSGVPHYGFRAIWNGNASTVTATYTVTLVLGFRNNI